MGLEPEYSSKGYSGAFRNSFTQRHQRPIPRDTDSTLMADVEHFRGDLEYDVNNLTQSQI